MLSRDRICWPTRFGKADLNLIFSKSSLQNMRGFDRITILSPSFHGLRKERLAQWPPFCVLNTTKNSRGVTSRKIGWGCAARFLKPSPYFRPKSEIFLTLFQTWSKIWYPTSDLKPDVWPECMTSCYGMYTVVCVDIKRGNGLIAKWRRIKWLILLENIPNSRLECTNHTLCHTKMAKKPYPLARQHTCIAYIRDYPPGWKKRCRLWVSLLTQAGLIEARRNMHR